VVQQVHKDHKVVLAQLGLQVQIQQCPDLLDLKVILDQAVLRVLKAILAQQVLLVQRVLLVLLVAAMIKI
jgi:hypothetical protein